MTFSEFKEMYFAGTLDRDATWRAYDLPGSVKENHVRSALKMLKLTYAGELAIPEFLARYNLTITREEARTLLGSWWLFSLIDGGRGKPRVAPRMREAG